MKFPTARPSKAEREVEKRTCANCGNQPDVPVGLVVICCPICGGRFSSSVKEWE
jgi:hypothetical protein